MFTEMCQIACGFVPVNLATAANPGDWVSMENFKRLAIIFFKGAGTAGDDPTITVTQATDAAGTGSKALNFQRVARKQGADLFAIGQFTTTAPAAGNTFTNDTLAETQAIIVIDIDANELDVNNGFKFVQATVSDVGTNAQMGALLYIPYWPRYAQLELPSVLA